MLWIPSPKKGWGVVNVTPACHTLSQLDPAVSRWAEGETPVLSEAPLGG